MSHAKLLSLSEPVSKALPSELTGGRNYYLRSTAYTVCCMKTCASGTLDGQCGIVQLPLDIHNLKRAGRVEILNGALGKLVVTNGEKR